MSSGWERRRQEYERATPPWADPVAIQQVYGESRTKRRFGYSVCVDHIVPLNHPHVCGLHCEDNMQIISEIANGHKSNNWWPDSWQEQLYFDLPIHLWGNPQMEFTF